jgi:hypothetical protein
VAVYPAEFTVYLNLQAVFKMFEILYVFFQLFSSQKFFRQIRHPFDIPRFAGKDHAFGLKIFHTHPYEGTGGNFI